MHIEGDDYDFGRHRPVNEFDPDIISFCDDIELGGENETLPCSELKVKYIVLIFTSQLNFC